MSAEDDIAKKLPGGARVLYQFIGLRSVFVTILVVATLVYTGFIADAYSVGEIGRVRAALALLCGGLLLGGFLVLGWFAIDLLTQFSGAMRAHEPLRYERHWGGLGNASGGWSLSRSFSLLVGSVVVLSLMLALVAQTQTLVEFVTKPDPSVKAATPVVGVKPAPAAHDGGSESRVAADAGSGPG